MIDSALLTLDGHLVIFISSCILLKKNRPLVDFRVGRRSVIKNGRFLRKMPRLVLRSNPWPLNQVATTWALAARVLMKHFLASLPRTGYLARRQTCAARCAWVHFDWLFRFTLHSRTQCTTARCTSWHVCSRRVGTRPKGNLMCWPSDQVEMN